MLPEFYRNRAAAKARGKRLSRPPAKIVDAATIADFAPRAPPGVPFLTEWRFPLDLRVGRGKMPLPEFCRALYHTDR